MPEQIRILLVDDHTVMRTGLRIAIERQPGLIVGAEAGNGIEAIEATSREAFDIILLDLDLGDQNGLDLLPGLRAAAQCARVIVLTGTRDAEEYRRAVRLGALGLVLKEQALDVLAQAIREVHAGRAWLDPALVARVMVDAAHEHGGELASALWIAELTERERAVITLICAGLRNRQIAERLYISPTTVVHHLTAIFRKLGVTNRLELVTFAHAHGLAQPPRQ